MGPPTKAQRSEQLEERLTDLDGSIVELVSKAVERGMEAMRSSLSTMLVENQTAVSQKFGAEFETLTTTLEGRLHRSREYHESLINVIRTEQLKFQSEIKSILNKSVALDPHATGGHREGSASKGSMVFMGSGGEMEGVILEEVQDHRQEGFMAAGLAVEQGTGVIGSLICQFLTGVTRMDGFFV